jgi:DNA-binding CsgD family transcriptional regulator
VWENTATLLFARDGGGRLDESREDAAFARDLHVGSVYNYLNYSLDPRVTPIAAAELQRAPQHAHPFLRAHRCDEAITLVFKKDGWACATIALYRNIHDPGTAPDAETALEQLYPVLKRLVLRSQHLTQQATLNTAATDFLGDLPVGLAFFSWQRELLFANDEGYRQAHAWNCAPTVVRLKDGELRERFVVAPEIHQAFNALRYEWDLSLARFEPMEATRLTVVHPRAPHLKIVASITVNRANPLQTPNFVTRFTSLNSGTDTAFEPSAAQISVLAKLTAAERAVAVLAMRGLDNRSIAAQLHREVSTVKDHLTRVYAKLGVKSRAQLASLTRGA